MASAKLVSLNNGPKRDQQMPEHACTGRADRPLHSIIAADRRAPPLVDKPRVAVLAFTNLTGGTAQEWLADGIAEDLRTALYRCPTLFVLAGSSSSLYVDRAVGLRRAARGLGARYLVEGSVRRAGSSVRVTARLIEAETGKYVWAEHYDRHLADIFALQDEIAQAVCIAIAPAVADEEQRRAMRRPPGSLDAWSAYQRGLWHLGQFRRADVVLAERFFARTIELDGTFAGGHSSLAWAQLYAANQFQIRSLSEAQRMAEASARRAVALDVTNAEAHASLAHALQCRGDIEGALAEAEQAVALAPNLADAHQKVGTALTMSGQPVEGLAALETSIRLDPRSPRSALRRHQMTVSLYFSREYEAAVEAGKRAIRFYPDFLLTYRWVAAALGQLGRTAEAKRVLTRATASSFGKHARPPWMPPDDHAHMLEGLRKAGWKG
jgi:adenylate cyclase